MIHASIRLIYTSLKKRKKKEHEQKKGIRNAAIQSLLAILGGRGA